MDHVLQAQFQRVETGLATLVDSIAAYNPSLQAAVDLIAADDDLARGLDQLAQHQANHARIQALRAEAEALEGQLKSWVAGLASLRRELLETPATTFPADSRPVPFDELLQFAKNIAKHTVPPTYRERIPKSEQDKEAEEGASSGAASNGLSTPAPAGAPAQVTAKDAADGAEAVPKDITEEEAEWLRKLKENQYPWVPWPDMDKIRRGNLMQIQYLRDTGQDPTQVDLRHLDEGEKSALAAEAQPTMTQAPVAEPAEVPVQAAPRSAAPKAPAETFSGFGFADDDDEP